MSEDINTPPTPIEAGETYDVEIEDIGKEGDGIARVDNFVVFVPGADVGDEVTIEIKTVKHTFGVGEIVD
ncbi:MAG: putative RNA-binding protein containing TRAM domain [Candidatus Methanohalarchaeum thermophilum]|uniref:RNA-binding protein containing TRAM domain n=1 Tax=Methanohalarchaeum thermophilum TaxID=1903181 RepID=A0A1Q6DV35_METT1|nr:MAG: putative RNA-binding protein containing TRAM domain [Candidatus Methanohalarchaeum thermophilum]